jgi:hypothetical protein
MWMYPMGPKLFVCRHVTQVLIMSHELSREDEMTDYFSRKFYPAVPVYVLGRSYAAKPECKPDQTLHDNWKEPSPLHVHHGVIGPLWPDACSLPEAWVGRVPWGALGSRETVKECGGSA